MAEKIKIFQLDIDVDAAISSQAKLKDTLNTSKQSLLDLKKAGDTSSKQYIELEASVKNLNREYNASQTQLGKLLTLQGKEIKTVKEGEAALTVINKEWAKQQQLFGTNSVEADKLAKKHAELKSRTNELRKGIGDTSTNVGNYSADMQEALRQTTFFSQAQNTLNSVLKIGSPVVKMIRKDILGLKANYKAATSGTYGYSAAQKAAAVGTNLSSAALRLFKIALISTGIGAIVVLLGSLVAWFSKTQKGIDLVNKVLAGLGAAFDVIIDRAAKFGGAVIKLFSGDITGGLSDMKESFSDIGDEIQREVDLAIKLEGVLQRVRKEQINLDIRRSAANARLKELNKTIEDVSKTEEERIKAAKDYAKIDNELTAQEVANQEKKVAAMLGFEEVTDEVRETIKKIGEEGVELEQLGISESTIEDMEAFKGEVVELFNIQAASSELQVTNQNKLNTIITQVRSKEIAAEKERAAAAKERVAEAQKVTDAAIKESKTRLQLFIEESKGKADTLKESIELEEQVRDKRLEILNQELEAKKLTQTEYELAVLETKNGFLEQQSNLTQEYANREIEIQKEKDDRLKEIEQLKAEAKVTDLENKLEIEQENFDLQMELLKERIGIERDIELAEAEKTGADKALILKKYAQIEKDINYEKESAKREQAADTFGGIAKLLGEQTMAGKAAGIAAATINTYQGVTEVLKTPSVLPEPFATISRVVNVGTVLGSGLKAVQKITSTNVPKAAKGITLRGKSHSEGGERLYDESGSPVVEAEGGENIYVLNKKASGMINSLSYLNQATGGVPLSQATTYAAAGGMIQRTASSTKTTVNPVDYNLMAEMTAEAVKNVQIYTSVTEINDGQGKYADVVNGANI